MADAGAPAIRQRLDKWLFHARFARTRTKAADLIRSGHVRVNGVRQTDPGKGVKIGDALTLALEGRTLLVRVKDFHERRGGPAEAERTFAPIDPGGQRSD